MTNIMKKEKIRRKRNLILLEKNLLNLYKNKKKKSKMKKNPRRNQKKWDQRRRNQNLNKNLNKNLNHPLKMMVVVVKKRIKIGMIKNKMMMKIVNNLKQTMMKVDCKNQLLTNKIILLIKIVQLNLNLNRLTNKTENKIQMKMNLI